MNTPASRGVRASALPPGFRPALSVAALLAASLIPFACYGQQKSLADKVQRLEDIEEIRTVLVNYGRTLDAHDFGAYARLFTRDGEWIGGFGSVKGTAAIEAFMAKNVGSPGKPNGTYHLLTNFMIDVHGDTATAWSRWAQGGRYEDKLVREDGRWKFNRREVFRDIPTAAK